MAEENLEAKASAASANTNREVLNRLAEEIKYTPIAIMYRDPNKPEESYQACGFLGKFSAWSKNVILYNGINTDPYRFPASNRTTMEIPSEHIVEYTVLGRTIDYLIPQSSQ